MTRLLVSVRHAREAHMAIQGGVDLLDVKEPRRGALGRADSQVIAECIALASDARLPCSAALGELAEIEAAEGGASISTNLQFAKVGLAGLADDPAWSHRLVQFWRHAPPQVTPVAVAYADWRRASAPAPVQVLEAAAEISCGVLLIDTFYKDGGGLLDLLTIRDIEQFIDSTHQGDMQIALAGSLQVSQVASLCQAGADIIAVRGAVCRGGRNDAVELELVRRLKNSITKECSLSPYVRPAPQGDAHPI